MDKETILNQLNTIENRVESLIAECKRLGTENTELEHQNELLRTQLEDKISVEKHNDEVKLLIRNKIDSLMGKLDGFTEG